MPAAYPLHWPADWPRTLSSDRQDASAFVTTFSEAREALLNEIELLGAKDPSISTNIPPRPNGDRRATIRDEAEDPGVAAYFSLRGRTFVIAADSYHRVSDNMRMAALSLNQIRNLERYGGAGLVDRALAGFTDSLFVHSLEALPAWCEILRIPPQAEKWMIEGAYRQRAKENHPDAGGSDALMAKINKARDDALKARS